MKERMFEFPVKDWIDAKEGVFAQAEYALSSNGFHDEPMKPPVKPNPFGLSEYRASFSFKILKRLVVTQFPCNCNAVFLSLLQNVSRFSSLFVGDCAEQCQHGGICVQGQCICPLNYEGKHCENGKLI